MMDYFKRMPYPKQLRLRIWCLRLLLVAFLVYSIIIERTGGGDSRIVTDQAHAVMVLIFFGGILWALLKIKQLKRLLANPQQMKETLLEERDERRRYIHDKSGGIVWDALFVCLLFITMTASLYNMAAFAVSQTILVLAILFKAGAWWFYSRG